jgi:hypothetical protein
MGHLRARCALAAAATSSARDPLLRVAEAAARALEREAAAWATALALLIRATLSAARGDRPDAIARLSDAETSLRAAGLALFAESAKRRRGQLVGGLAGDELVSQSEIWMTGQGIRNPTRMAAMCAPGFDRT